VSNARRWMDAFRLSMSWALMELARLAAVIAGATLRRVGQHELVAFVDEFSPLQEVK